MSKTPKFASVWDAVEDTPLAAAGMRARSELMMALQSWVETSGITQAEAAKLLGVTQPRMSDLMRGKISLFSLETLMDMAMLAGMDPRVTVKKPKSVKKAKTERVLAAA